MIKEGVVFITLIVLTIVSFFIVAMTSKPPKSGNFTVGDKVNDVFTAICILSAVGVILMLFIR